jgi:NADH dehydrogenase [ubiquinone] 1 alpha subcomplex assembly factor 1
VNKYPAELYAYSMTESLLLFTTSASVLPWRSVDDGVMGGLSQSRISFNETGYALFSGRVSLERNGGFASTRCLPADFSANENSHYLITVRGDGKRYKLIFRMEDAFDAIGYQADFETAADDWAEIKLLCSDFIPTFRGRAVAGAPRLNPARVRQVGFMIADKQAGQFQLAIRSLNAAQEI